MAKHDKTDAVVNEDPVVLVQATMWDPTTGSLLHRTTFAPFSEVQMFRHMRGSDGCATILHVAAAGTITEVRQ